MAESATEKGAEAAIPMEAAKMNESRKEVPPGNFKVIMLGATGATGCYVVGELLSSKEFKEVTLVGRRKFTALPEVFKIDLANEESSGHLKQIVLDLEEANEENALKYFEGMDAYITCFGTTKANAGSNANFRHIDHGYNVKFAELAKKAGVHFCSLLSSSGAHPRSYFSYLKVKGEIEDAFTRMEFPFLTIFKPGLLDRKKHMRFQEKLAGIFMTKMPIDTLAKAIVADAVNQLKKDKAEERHSHVLSNHQIFDLAKAYNKDQEPASEAVAETTGKAATETDKEENAEDGKKDEEVKVEGLKLEGASEKEACEDKLEEEENAEKKDDIAATSGDSATEEIKGTEEVKASEANDGEIKDN